MLSDINFQSLQKRRNILRQLFSSSNNKLYRHYNNFSTNRIYYHQSWTYRQFTTKESNYVPQYLLTNSYLMLINLSALTYEQKTRKRLSRRDYSLCPGNNFFINQCLCLTLIIREPHFHLTLNLTFKGFSQLLSVTLSQYHSFIAPYIHNRCPNFHLQL